MPLVYEYCEYSAVIEINIIFIVLDTAAVLCLYIFVNGKYDA